MTVVNIEAYDAEYLRKLVRLFEYENKAFYVFGGERMYMQNALRTEDIFHNEIIDGIIDFVRNS